MVRVKVAVKQIRDLINGDPGLEKPTHCPCTRIKEEQGGVYLDQYRTTAPV
jgi:hypothetical protein